MIIDLGIGSGLVRRFRWQNSTSEFAIESQQDITEILAGNVRRYNDAGDPRVRIPEDMRHVARVPLVVLEKWRNEEGIDPYDKNDWPKIKAKLNDPDNRMFRTHPGRI